MRKNFLGGRLHDLTSQHSGLWSSAVNGAYGHLKNIRLSYKIFETGDKIIKLEEMVVEGG